jgi:putative hydrolase of the HAD superfamily
MQQYNHLFFDLDHTLWDFKTNSVNTLHELYEKYKLDNAYDSFNQFYEKYELHNEKLWSLYREGKLTKIQLNFQRFYLPFSEAGITDEQFTNIFAKEYITVNPTKTNLMPNALNVLNQLKPHFKLHVITNGFKEVQNIKLKNSNLQHFFSKVFISETIGASKPKTTFFEYAVKSANARKKECLIIGDNLGTDINGAINFGLDYVYYNPEKIAHNRKLMHEISDLTELFSIVYPNQLWSK